jgi:hypothetical protein
LLWTIHLLLRIRYTRCINYWHDLAEFFFATLAFAIQAMAFLFSVSVQNRWLGAQFGRHPGVLRVHRGAALSGAAGDMLAICNFVGVQLRNAEEG